MRRRMLFLASGLVGAVLIQAPVQAAQDLSCADFPNQEAAQKEFDRYGTDVNGLDRDGDKIACEWISVGGRVFIEDSPEAMAAIRQAGGPVPGLTYGNPSGAQAELRSVPPAGEAPTGGFGSGTQAQATRDQSGTTGSAGPGQSAGSSQPAPSGQSADEAPWKSEETQESATRESATRESGEINDPTGAAGAEQTATDAQAPEQVITDDAVDPSATAMDSAQALPNTGPPARDVGLGYLAMSLIAAGFALLKGAAYRPRRLAARR